MWLRRKKADLVYLAIFFSCKGWPDNGGLIDDDRIEFLHDHLKQILDAVLNDQVNLKGYTG